jgi:hypothetical protein
VNLLWYRVFGTNDTEPAPAALLEHLHALSHPVTGNFTGDDRGWYRAELVYAPTAGPVTLERFLVSEEGIRAELNTWAAWIETNEDNPHQARLMQHMIGTTQLFTLRQPETADTGLADRICLAACQFLARTTAGVYQADNLGFFDPGGLLLLKEC